MKFALISLGFVLGLTASAVAQIMLGPGLDAMEPGSLWRATSTHHIEAVTLQELCQ